MTTESTIIAAAVALWFAQGWYLNTRLERVHKKLDLVLEQFDGLRRYLYEKDPQFDDERQLLGSVAGMDYMDLIKQKEKQGKRTLNSPL